MHATTCLYCFVALNQVNYTVFDKEAGVVLHFCCAGHYRQYVRNCDNTKEQP